jgi:hypothetical protein
MLKHFKSQASYLLLQHHIPVGTEATEETSVELEVEYSIEPELVDPKRYPKDGF